MELPDVGAANATPEEIRDRYTRGEKVPGFFDALFPTLEEKVVTEHLPVAEHMHALSMEENLEREEQEKTGSTPVEAKVGDRDGQNFGPPADMCSAPEMDDQPPHARMGKNDANAEEQKTLRARAILRKHLNAKSSQSPWTPPTPRPDYAAHSFEDPVCDKFWKGIWVACAVHTVGVCAGPELMQRPMCSY